MGVIDWKCQTAIRTRLYNEPSKNKGQHRDICWCDCYRAVIFTAGAVRHVLFHPRTLEMQDLLEQYIEGATLPRFDWGIPRWTLPPSVTNSRL
jgi:hypothetical protein